MPWSEGSGLGVGPGLGDLGVMPWPGDRCPKKDQKCKKLRISISRFATTISTTFELETRGCSQIQADEKIFPDVTYNFKLDSLEVEIY